MGASDELKRRKKALRREVRARRDAITPEERAAKSAAIAERTVQLPEIGGARTILAFSSFGSEVDTAPLIELLVSGGRRVALPRVAGRDVEVVAYRPGDPTQPAPFGAMEPVGGLVVPPEEVDVMITPGLAFDRHGNRAGYGGGFYDRLFRRARPDVVKVAVAFSIQLVDDVPAGPADRLVDLIVTEGEVVRCG